MLAPPTLTQTLYLPLTRSAAAAFLDHGNLPSTMIEKAALYVLALLLKPAPLNASSVEDALRETEQLFAQSPEEDVVQFIVRQCAACRERSAEGVDEVLERQGISFAADEVMQARAWCGANGRYTLDFQDRCRDTLHDFHLAMTLSRMRAPMRDDSGSEGTDEIPDALDSHTKAIMYAPRRSAVLRGTTDQARAASIIAAAPDEHYELLAYAGTGKTHLIHELGSRVPRWVHLAPTKAHRFAFHRRFNPSTGTSLVMANLASTMAGNLMGELGYRVARVPQFAHSDCTLSQQAVHAGIKAVGRLAPFEVMRVVDKAIQRWCFSDRQELSTDDVKGVYALAEKQIVLAYAQKVWGMLFMLEQPSQRQVFAFRSYHLVKWLSISGGKIPAMGLLVLDEAHDLSPAWITLLNNYRDGVVLMGDPYQRLHSTGRPTLNHATQIAMARSVRTGQQVTPEIQNVLNHHGGQLIPDPLEGSRDHVTRLRKYDRLSQTPDVGLRVYGSFGQMLGDAQRLTNEGAPFHILGSSFSDFQAWAAHAIDVFNRADKSSESHELHKFKSWQTLSRHLNATGQHAVVSLIERGYSHRHLQALLRAGQTPTDGRPPVVTLAKLEHTKSLEEDVVVLAPCCFGSGTGLTDKERMRFLRSIYVAMSRVRAELWVHGDGMDRLEQPSLPAGAQTSPGRGGLSR